MLYLSALYRPLRVCLETFTPNKQVETQQPYADPRQQETRGFTYFFLGGVEVSLTPRTQAKWTEACLRVIGNACHCCLAEERFFTVSGRIFVFVRVCSKVG